MQFKKSFSALLFSTVAICACKKNHTDPAVPAATVKTNDRFLLKSVHNYESYEFQYNPDKTVKSYSWANGQSRVDFSYPLNKVVYTIYNSGKKAGYCEYLLNNGTAQKLTATYYDTNGNITGIYSSDYTYNSAGQMIREDYRKDGTGNGHTIYNYNNDGNLASFIYTDANGNLVVKHEYEYYMSLPDKSFSFGQFNSNCQGSVIPKKANHLISKDLATDNSGTKTYTHTYTLDAQGYVLTGLIKDEFGAEKDNWTNSWQ